MSNRITVSPVTRVEGHLGVELDVSDHGKVVAAKMSGTMFRGFESIMLGRDPRDAIHLTQRICGVCPVPHARAAVEVVERAFGIEVSPNAHLLRNLVQGAGLVSDHILHFYHLALLDYVHGPGFPPYTPAYSVDQRFAGADADRFLNDYMMAFEMRKMAQEMGAIFAGKLPHVMTFAPGGVTQQPTAANVAEFGRLLAQLIDFIDGTYVPDVEQVAETYPEYRRIGGGPRNLLSFGAFDDGAGNPLFAPGHVWSPGHHRDEGRGDRDGHGHGVRGRVDRLTPADVAAIDESVKHAWYADAPHGHHPEPTDPPPVLEKRGAYSWVKAPRLHDRVYQVGAIARLIVDGSYRGGVSVMDRLLANAYETSRIATAMRSWLDALALDGSGYQAPGAIPTSGSAYALVEAARGSLAHWLEYDAGKVTGYRIITPTAWNSSPRDDREEPGPMEQALVGVEIADRTQPVEIYRVIHSFDPCMGCAVHVTVIDA
jgi:hydrogenase large subunit